MKYVYIVEETYAYDGSAVLGVFSSVAKAKRFLDKNYITTSVVKPERSKDFWLWTVRQNQWLSISKREVDKAK